MLTPCSAIPAIRRPLPSRPAWRGSWSGTGSSTRTESAPHVPRSPGFWPVEARNRVDGNCNQRGTTDAHSCRSDDHPVDVPDGRMRQKRRLVHTHAGSVSGTEIGSSHVVTPFHNANHGISL